MGNKDIKDKTIIELEFELWRLKHAPYEEMDHDRMGAIAEEIKERALNEIE
ncbi:hypothetical protein KLEB303S_gp48 [Bacillus phage vB_BceS_KLEB30-3S]|nr:hypothetical protein KLEB303S_gp48 [Bacillus phage vB_BceS_KLEB30-3S]